MMDFRGFQKIKEDADTVHMKHKNGHVIILAMKALPVGQRDKIKRLKLADGTPPDSVPAPDDAPAALTPQEQPSAPDISDQPTGAQQESQKTLNATDRDRQALMENVPLATQDMEMQRKALNNNIYQNQLLNNNAIMYSNQMKGHTDDFAQHYKDIDPKAYLENMGAGQKTATAIGLFLGGFGVPFGGHNFAQDFLDKQIDRNVQAQRENADHQKTIWGAYKDLYGDNVVANNLARVSANDMQKKEIEQSALMNPSQRALLATKLRADQLDKDSAKQRLEAGAIMAEKYRSGMAPKQQVPGSLQPAPMNQKLMTPQPGMSGESAATTIAPQESGPTMSQDQMAQMQATNNVRANTGFKPLSEDEYRKSIGMKAGNAKEKDFVAPAFEPMLRQDKNIDSAYQGLKLNPMVNSADLDKEYRNAQAADKNLKELPNVFNNLTKERSLQTRLGDSFDPNSIPGDNLASGIVKGIGSLAGSVTNSNTREYRADQSALKGILSAALPGRGDEFVRDIAEKNAPVQGDTPAALKKKYETIVKFIKDHTDTPTLKANGLLDPREVKRLNSTEMKRP